MRTFDVQGIEIEASRTAVFAYIRDPRNLPKWAHAFRRADDEKATLATPNGSVEVGLSIEADEGVAVNHLLDVRRARSST
jgi:hypothetical protein